MPRPINRDPSRPRGHMSAYAFYVQDRREIYRRQGVKVNFAEFSKECSTLWKTMTVEQRNGYQQLAEHDKIRYRSETERYKGRLSAISGVKKRGRKKKQPGEPKRNMCAFLFFCSEKRPQLKAQNPGASVGLLAKQLAGAWKLMAADQKRPYEIMADRDKERYDQQKAAYQAGYQASQMQQEMSGSQSSFNFSPTTSNALTMPVVPGISSLPQISQQVTIPANGGATSSSPLLSVASSSRTRKKKDPNMPKRSMSGFMFFSLAKRPQLRAQTPKANVGAISKQLAAAWNVMNPQQKAPYDELAKKDKERYDRELLEYKAGRFGNPDPRSLIDPVAVATVTTVTAPDVDLTPEQVVTVSTVTNVGHSLQVGTSENLHGDASDTDQLYQYMYQTTN